MGPNRKTLSTFQCERCTAPVRRDNLRQITKTKNSTLFVVYACLPREPQLLRGVISKFPNRNRIISTSRLNALLRVHLKPINLIISQDSQTIPYLKVGFPLRCFQRLSIPDIATRQCRRRDSRYTRGQFTPVLSYQERIFSRINGCSRQETNLSHASTSIITDGIGL